MVASDAFLFVSHVAEDKAAATEIVGELERRGVRCWIAPRNVHPGRPYDDEIADAIEASRAMLLIFSEHCNENQYIRRELTVAGESRKLVIPFRIEDAHPRRGLGIRLADLHWIDGFVSRETALDQLVETIGFGEVRAEARPRRPEEEQGVAEAEQAPHAEEPGEAEEAHRAETRPAQQPFEDGRHRPDIARAIAAAPGVLESGDDAQPLLRRRIPRRALMAGGVVTVATGAVGVAAWMIRSQPPNSATNPSPPPSPSPSSPAVTNVPATPGTILSDPLTSWPLNLGGQTQQVFLKNGAVHIIANPNQSVGAPYLGFSFTNMDATLTITSVSSNSVTGGLMFWNRGPHDYFVFMISDHYKTFALVHRTATWDTLVNFTSHPGIKSGAGESNVLRIVTQGNSLSLYINGQPIGNVAVEAPATGGTIGLWGQAAAETVEYAFSNLSVKATPPG